MKTDLSADIRTLALPVTALVVLVILSFVLIKFGLSKFTLQEGQISDTQKEIATLEQKDLVLKQISENIQGDAQAFSVALPNSDPTTAVISHIKTLSVVNSLVIDTLSSRPSPKSDTISQAVITVSLQGSVTSLLSFLNTLGSVSPLVSIKSVDLNTDKVAGYTAEVTMNSYWAPFPKTIPATTDPITELTPSEKNMISQIASLTPPSFTTINPQSPSNQRISPF